MWSSGHSLKGRRDKSQAKRHKFNNRLGGKEVTKYKSAVLRDAIKEAVEHLPEKMLAEVFDFVRYLLAKEERERREEKEEGKKLDPKTDPILNYYIGGISHGSLAKDIDRELYGE
jgi:hypothetical protein